MYKVEFSFFNDRGQERRDDLTNNGRGFTRAEAEDLARELMTRELFDIEIVELSEGDAAGKISIEDVARAVYADKVREVYPHSADVILSDLPDLSFAEILEQIDQLNELIENV